MEARKKPVRIAVLDYDGCAFTHYMPSKQPGIYRRNIYPFLLSSELIKDVKQRGCEAFYACTHRTVTSIFGLTLSTKAHDIASKLHKTKFQPTYALTHKITEHLQLLLDQPCLAVSTLDDYVDEVAAAKYEGCGVGYDKYIKPYELALAALVPDKMIALQTDNQLRPSITKDVLDAHKRPSLKAVWNIDGKRCKNEQLLMLARDVKRKYPQREIELYFYDDMDAICDHALKIDPQRLPANLSLHVLKHSGKDLTTNYLGVVTGPSLNRSGVFSIRRDSNVQEEVKKLSLR